MKLVLFDTRIVENIIYLNFRISACYHYDTHNYNSASGSIFFYFKVEWCLSRIYFSGVSHREETSQMICGANHLTAINCIKFWDFLIFLQILLLPQVKRSANVTYKYGIYEFPHELPNADFRKLGNIRKVSKLHKMIA